jgi:Uma2 family endonuclease
MLEEFLKLPETKPALEFRDGVVTRKGEPTGQHSRLQMCLTSHIGRYAELRRLALAFPGLRITFAGVSYAVDVAVYRWERIPWGPDGELPDDIYGTPDIAVEVASPEEDRTTLVEKCEWYVAHGAALALLVDPDDRSVMAFRPGEEPAVLYGADAIDFAPVLPGLRLRVRTLFGWLRPRRPRRQP